jgi:chromosome partitioning protein
MQVLTLVVQKGGTGKSMLAVNLAVEAARAGMRPVVLDLDSQRTAVEWGQSREDDEPPVVDSEAARPLGAALARLASAGFDLAVIDTPGHDSPAIREAIRAATYCLVPVRPSEFDLRALGPTLRALNALGASYGVVVNQMPPGPQRKRLATAVQMRLAGSDVLPVTLTTRMDVQYANALGKGISEYAPASKSAQEIQSLWHHIRRRLTHAEEERCA